MEKLILSVFLSCFVFLASSKLEVIVRNVTVENINGAVFEPDLQIQKYNRTSYVLNGRLRFVRTIDESLKINVMVNYFKGSVKLNTFEVIHDKTFCETIDGDEYMWMNLVQASEIPAKCPFEPNEYVIKNFRPNSSALPISTPDGIYDIESLYSLDGEPLQKLIVTFNVITT